MLPVVRELRQEQKDRALITAVKANDAKAVVRLLKEGADANAKDVPLDRHPIWRKLWDCIRRRSKRSNNAPTALLLAMPLTEQKTKSLSLPAGTTVMWIDWYHHRTDPAIARALLEHGSDPNVFARDGTSPLLDAFIEEEGKDEADAISILMIQHGARLDTLFSDYLMPAFIMAAWDDKVHALEAMLDRDVNINCRDVEGQTALMSAVYHNDVSMVRFLLAHHADVSIKDPDGKTALQCTDPFISPEARQIIRMLRQAGAR